MCVVEDVFKGEIYFFQAEAGLRDVEGSRGLGDVYKNRSQNSVKVRFTISSRHKTDILFSSISNWSTFIDDSESIGC